MVAPGVGDIVIRPHATGVSQLAIVQECYADHTVALCTVDGKRCPTEDAFAVTVVQSWGAEELVEMGKSICYTRPYR